MNHEIILPRQQGCRPGLLRRRIPLHAARAGKTDIVANSIDRVVGGAGHQHVDFRGGDRERGVVPAEGDGGADLVVG